LQESRNIKIVEFHPLMRPEATRVVARAGFPREVSSRHGGLRSADCHGCDIRQGATSLGLRAASPRGGRPCAKEKPALCKEEKVDIMRSAEPILNLPV
jgi:hypothetical protein